MNPPRRRWLAGLLAAPLLLATGAAATAQTLEALTLDHKRRGSPVDPLLASWAAPSAGLSAVRPDTALSPGDWPVILREDGIVIDAASNGDPQALLAELQAIGLTEGAVSGNAVSGVLPFDAIGDLEACASLAMVRPALATTSRRSHRREVGAVTSQGVAAMQVDRLPPSVTGAGASVGILSDTFDCVGGGAAQDVASGDLPPDVVILDDPPILGCLDESRALAQVVHDVAPASRLGVHTGFNGQADFAEGILELAQVFGADVIVDDVIYFTEPYFQDGPIARAVDAVHAQGVTYVSAAGNAGRESYEAPFRDSGENGFFQILGETRRHDFDPGPGVDVFQTITLQPATATLLLLQWDESFASASTASPPLGAASDYDLIVYNTESPIPLDFSTVAAQSSAFNAGGDPFEFVLLRNFGTIPLELYVSLERFEPPGLDGPDVERLKYIAVGFPLDPEWATHSGTSFGHANAAGAISVGAAAWFETPRFGVSPPRLETFSSAGGVPIVLDPTGARLSAPDLRDTPDLVAPDGVNTTFFPAPGDIGEDDDAFPNFFGTSASAAHVAAVAALLQGRVHGGTAVLDRKGALRALRMCFEGRRGRSRNPHTFDVAPSEVPGALMTGATLGPCGALTPGDVEHLLEASAIDMLGPGPDLDSGHGLVDAPAALRALPRLRRRGSRPSP